MSGTVFPMVSPHFYQVAGRPARRWSSEFAAAERRVSSSGLRVRGRGTIDDDGRHGHHEFAPCVRTTPHCTIPRHGPLIKAKCAQRMC
jgi:hypothetical protein